MFLMVKFCYYRSKYLSSDLESVENIQKSQHKAYKELNQRIARERQLGILQEKMQAKKMLNNKKGENSAQRTQNYYSFGRNPLKIY